MSTVETWRRTRKANMKESKKSPQKSMLVMGLVAGAGIATAVALFWQNRKQRPEQVISGAISSCDRAVQALQNRLRSA